MVNNDIFVGSGTSLTFIPEVDFYIKPLATPVTADTTVRIHTTDMGQFRLVVDMYVGSIIEFWDTSTGLLISTHRVTGNTYDTFTFHPAITAATYSSSDYFILKGYGSPCPAPKTLSIARLLSDEWLGIVDSATFPNIEIDMKQHNLFIGGSRNLTFQYKGLETASGGSFEVAANHGAWLYYTLGKCTGATSASIAAANSGVTDSFTATSDGIFIDNAAHLETGPIFYRSVGTDLVPPLMPTDAFGSMDTITNPTTNSHLITYTFEEASGHELPSFALERTYSKLSSATDTYLTETGAASETENFVTVARGNRVNSLTITGSEQDPIKMNLDLNTRAVHALGQTEAYEARNGVETETSFFNYNSNDSFLEPFFFHEGTIKMFGQNFLKITQFTLTINNNIADKRYIGISSREVKDGIPAQRTYELTFTAHVTDNMLFEEFRNLTETSGSLIELIFTKANNEKITIKLDDYFITSNNWNIPDDKGPIDVEATIQARSLDTCEVISHWILQG